MITRNRVVSSNIKSIREALEALKKYNVSSKKGKKTGATKDSSNPPFKAVGNKADIDRITLTAKTLAQSETGLALLQTAYDNNYKIAVQKIGNALGYCDPNKKMIVLNANCSDDQNIGTLAHELTHAKQFINGAGCIDNIDTKSYFMETRVMEADAEARAGLALMELKTKGVEEPWQCFTQDSPTVARGLERAFKQEGLETTKARNNVLTCAFKSWYNNNNIKNSYDKDNVYFLNEMLEKNEHLPLNQPVTPKEFIDVCCKLDNGSNYFSDNPDVLLEAKYLGVTQTTMTALKKFMKDREAKQGLPYDKSIDELPVIKSKANEGIKKVSKNVKMAVQHILSKNLHGK